jgi:hypothetical protein
MSRLDCVALSEGLDVTDRKACFLSLLAQAAVWLLELRVSRTFLDQLRPKLFRPLKPSSDSAAKLPSQHLEKRPAAFGKNRKENRDIKLGWKENASTP